MPRYDSTYTTGDLKEILAILENSGYVSELPEYWGNMARKHFVDTWDRLRNNPGLAFLSCRPPSLRHIATSMTTRQHPHLWMHHHLSLRRDIRQSQRFPEAISEALAVAFEDTYEAGDARYVEALCNASKRFNQTLYGGYHRAYPDADDFRLESYTLYDFPAGILPVIDTETDISVVPVDLADIPAEIILRYFSRTTADAYDLLPNRLDFERYRQRCLRGGLSRDRFAMGARTRDDRIAAWAIIDVTVPEPSLFGLTNQTYLLPASPQAPETAMAKAQLINMASKVYHFHGIPWFKVQSPRPDSDIAPHAAASAKGNRWIGPIDAIPRWVSYLRGHFHQTLRDYYDHKRSIEA